MAPDALAFRVVEYGEFIVLRSDARKARLSAIGLLAQHEDADTLVLDFTGVAAVTNGVADELVANLIDQQDDRHILIKGATDEVWDAITTVLERRRMPIEGRAVLPERSEPADG